MRSEHVSLAYSKTTHVFSYLCENFPNTDYTRTSVYWLIELKRHFENKYIKKNVFGN